MDLGWLILPHEEPPGELPQPFNKAEDMGFPVYNSTHASCSHGGSSLAFSAVVSIAFISGSFSQGLGACRKYTEANGCVTSLTCRPYPASRTCVFCSVWAARPRKLGCVSVAKHCSLSSTSSWAHGFGLNSIVQQDFGPTFFSARTRLAGEATGLGSLWTVSLPPAGCRSRSRQDRRGRQDHPTRPVFSRFRGKQPRLES